MVEVALILPLLFIFVFGIIEAGRMMWVQHTLQEATDAAARCAAINTVICPDAAAVTAYAAEQAVGIGVDAADFSHTSEACGEKVAISYHYISVVAALVPFDINLDASACHPE